MNNAEMNLGQFLVNDFGDRYLYRVNRNAFDRVGSDALYSSFYGERLLEPFQLNIFVGADSGILPSYIAKCGVPSGSRYIFVELPEVLETLRRDPVLENLPAEITVTTLEDFLERTEDFQLEYYALLAAVLVRESLGASDANLPEYRNLSWRLHEALDSLVHKLITSANTLPFILRQFDNLAENQICFSQALHRAFPDRTAIILAGGPSLSEALPWVRENKDRLVVVAVSRICRTLRQEGIVPHIIASVDPTELSFEISKEMLWLNEHPEPPLFIASYHVTSRLLGQWAGRHLYTGPMVPWQSPLNTDALAYNGPTVSNFALSLCEHMGCPDIVLAGVNLCYSADGQTHAEGSNESKIGPDLGQMSTRIETYGGWQAETNNDFTSSRAMLTLQAQEITAKGTRIYNCSRNAAKVPLVEYRSLDELSLDQDAAPVSEIIANRLPPSTVATRLTHYRKVQKEINRARLKLQEILKLAHEALRCTDGLFGLNGMQRDFRHKIRMDKIERRLDRSFGQFSTLVKHCGIGRFFRSLKTTMAEEMTDEQLEQGTRQYYETYVEGTEFLIERLAEVERRVAARIEEDKKSPDFEKLAAQWETDRHFGRAQVWRKRNPEKMPLLTELERVTLERLEQEFQRVMTEEHTSHVVHIQNRHDLKHTRSKALLLFQRGETAELESLAKGLIAHPDQEKAHYYLHFVKGLLAELRQESAEAIDHYQQLFTDPPHQLTEDALLQVANLSISLNHADNALLALECLVGISVTYLPAYAELLKALGRFDAAFHAYNRYLGHFPEDVTALLSLAQLCKQAGLDEQTQELLQRVLAKDPLNAAAALLAADPAGVQGDHQAT